MNRYIPFFLLAFLFLFSCSDEEKVRMPDDILGVWTPGDNLYVVFKDDNTVSKLQVEYQDDVSIGRWAEEDVYYYEPGYNLVIYVSSDMQANVYKIVKWTPEAFTWGWVDDIDISNQHDIGHIIGNIINKAQEGYFPEPDSFVTYNKVSEDQYYALLESLDIIYNPWDEDDDDDWDEDDWY